MPMGSVKMVWQEVASVSAIKAGREPSVLKVSTHTHIHRHAHTETHSEFCHDRCCFFLVINKDPCACLYMCVCVFVSEIKDDACGGKCDENAK